MNASPLLLTLEEVRILFDPFAVALQAFSQPFDQRRHIFRAQDGHAPALPSPEGVSSESAMVDLAAAVFDAGSETVATAGA